MSRNIPMTKDLLHSTINYKELIQQDANAVNQMETRQNKSVSKIKTKRTSFSGYGNPSIRRGEKK